MQSSQNEVMPEDGRSCYEPPHPLLVPVARVLHQREDAVRLCGEILATLGLPRNQESIERLVVGGFIDAGPIENFNKMLESWNKRFKECSGK